MAVNIRLRRDTLANWLSNNPTLLLGEPGIATDKRRWKVGDGATAWDALPYMAGGLPEGWVSVKDYGAVGDGSTDDTDAIQDAIEDAKTNHGAVIYLPPTVANVYKIAGHLDFTTISNGTMVFKGCQGFQWWGGTGGTATQGRTRVKFTALDSQPGINAQMAQGLIIEDLQFEYANGFTGVLIDAGSPGGVGSNHVLIQRCHFISDNLGTYRTAKSHISLNGSVCAFIDLCTFHGAQSLIRGSEPGFPSFANVVEINRSSFEACTVGMIVNPVLQWYITKCTFEFTDAGTPYGITSDFAPEDVPPGWETDIYVDKCSFWDPAASGQKPIYQPPGMPWKMSVTDSWFHTFTGGPLCDMQGPGEFTFFNNRYGGLIPTYMPTLIDLGDPVTAHKDHVYIVANKWGQTSGDTSLTIANADGHSNVTIEKNQQTGVWATESAWVINPSNVDLTDFQSGKKFKGGSVNLMTTASVGSSWELHALAFTGAPIACDVPAGVTLYLDGTASSSGSARVLTVTSGMVRITMTNGAIGGDTGFYNVEVHGTYTLV